MNPVLTPQAPTLNSCLFLSTWRNGVQRLTISKALAELRRMRRSSDSDYWEITRQAYTGYVKITLTGTRSPGVMVLRLPYGVEVLLDGRYRITETWVGLPKKRWVVWFCGEFISHHATDMEAARAAYEYRRDTQNLPVRTGIETPVSSGDAAATPPLGLVENVAEHL